MKTTEINGITYNVGKLNAFDQLHVARKIGPLLSDLFTAFRSNPDALSDKADMEGRLLELAMGPFADGFAKMSKEDVDFVVNTCLAVCDRRQEKGFAKVMANGVLHFTDIEIDTLLGLTVSVIWENLGRFFPTSQPE